MNPDGVANRRPVDFQAKPDTAGLPYHVTGLTLGWPSMMTFQARSVPAPGAVVHAISVCATEMAHAAAW